MLTLFGSLFGSRPFAQDPPVPSSPPPDATWYRTPSGVYFGLQNQSVVSRVASVRLPSLALSERSNPRTDGSYAETAVFTRRTVRVEGTVRSPDGTMAGLESLIDQMASAVGSRGGSLGVQFSGMTRVLDDCYPTGLESLLDARGHGNITSCPFSFEVTSMSATTRSPDRRYFAPVDPCTAPTTYQPSTAGNARTKAVWNLTVTAVGTMTAMTLANAATGESMTLSAAFASGDTVVIDGEKCAVTLNGHQVNWSGVIPSIKPSAVNSVTLTPNGSGYSVSVTEANYDRWM